MLPSRGCNGEGRFSVRTAYGVRVCVRACARRTPGNLGEYTAGRTGATCTRVEEGQSVAEKPCVQEEEVVE